MTAITTRMQKDTFEVRLYGETVLLTEWKLAAIARYRTLCLSGGHAQSDVVIIQTDPNNGTSWEITYPVTTRMGRPWPGGYESWWT
jgi:hypothetical protein